MDKFPILCTLSALLVFLGAAVSVAGVQTVKKSGLPFGLNSVEQVQRSVDFASMTSTLNHEAVMFGQLDLPRGGNVSRAPEIGLVPQAENSVAISGNLLVSF